MMTDWDSLRIVMELEGYDAETIEQTLAKCEGWDLAAAMAGLEAMGDYLRQFVAGAAQSMAELFEAIAGGQLAPLPAKLPRPPRDTRPKNMAAYRTPRPARVARSSCRKIRR